MFQTPRTDADTPPHGDFASYVERLTAQPPGQQAPGRTQPHSEHTHLAPDAVPGKMTLPGGGQGPAGVDVEALAQKFALGVRVLRGVLLLAFVFGLLSLWRGNWGAVSFLVPVAIVGWLLGKARLSDETKAKMQAASRRAAAIAPTPPSKKTNPGNKPR